MVWKAMITPRSPASAHWSVMAAFAAKTTETIFDFASVVHNLVMDVRDSYRPELHYMRGPGPKWRAKHLVRTRLEQDRARHSRFGKDSGPALRVERAADAAL